jgi:hypothetical protein
MRQAWEAFQDAWSVEIRKLSIGSCHPRQQFPRSSRAEATVTIVEYDKSAWRICAECCSKHAGILLPSIKPTSRGLNNRIPAARASQLLDCT